MCSKCSSIKLDNGVLPWKYPLMSPYFQILWCIIFQDRVMYFNRYTLVVKVPITHDLRPHYKIQKTHITRARFFPESLLHTDHLYLSYFKIHHKFLELCFYICTLVSGISKHFFLIIYNVCWIFAFNYLENQPRIHGVIFFTCVL